VNNQAKPRIMSRIMPRIMLIDDEPGVIFALKLMLEALECEVLPFSQGKLALETLKTDQRFDFILCDLRMPELDGFDVLTAVKSLNSNIPFILISGHATAEDIERGKALGISSFLGKPFSAQDLKEILSKILI